MLRLSQASAADGGEDDDTTGTSYVMLRADTTCSDEYDDGEKEGIGSDFVDVGVEYLCSSPQCLSSAGHAVPTPGGTTPDPSFLHVAAAQCEVMHVSFNHTGTRLVLGLTDGFAIVDAATGCLIERVVLQGGVGLADVLADTTLVVAVGCGRGGMERVVDNSTQAVLSSEPSHSTAAMSAVIVPPAPRTVPIGEPNVVHVYSGTELRAKLECHFAAYAVRLCPERVVVGVCRAVEVFHLLDGTRLFSVPTLAGSGMAEPSTFGHCSKLAEATSTSAAARYTAIGGGDGGHGYPIAVSYRLQRSYVCVPGVEEGVLLCVSWETGEVLHHIATGHNSSIACVEVSADGALVASASTTGTVVKVFSVASGCLVVEVRRGTTPNSIIGLSFSSCGGYLAVVSGTPTLRIFATTGRPIQDDKTANTCGSPRSASNTASVLAPLGFIAPYFESQWCVAQENLLARLVDGGHSSDGIKGDPGSIGRDTSTHCVAQGHCEHSSDVVGVTAPLALRFVVPRACGAHYQQQQSLPAEATGSPAMSLSVVCPAFCRSPLLNFAFDSSAGTLTET